MQVKTFYTLRAGKERNKQRMMERTVHFHLKKIIVHNKITFYFHMAWLEKTITFTVWWNTEGTSVSMENLNASIDVFNMKLL